VARVAAAAAAVASEVKTRGALEAAKQSAEDRATAAQSAAATAVTKRDALAMRFALAEAEIKKLLSAVASTNEAAERATAASTATDITARDAAQAAAQEKVVLETKGVDLERNFATSGVDLRTANRQFSEVANQLQVVSKEATRLWESNAKLLEDLEGESTRRFLSPFSLLACLLIILTCLLVLQECACTTPG
jgi:vacuolar-type H+-ATPase subunit D/Vma8